MKFLKSMFGALSETKQLPGLIREAEVLYRAGNFPAAIRKADEALALKSAFAPRTAHLLYLRPAALINTGNLADAVETWKNLIARDPSELPSPELYPVLKQILPDIADLLYNAICSKKQPGSYFLRLSTKDNTNYIVRTNSLYVKDEIKYISSILADIVFIVSKQSTLELTAYYENSSDGGVDSELILRKTFTLPGKK